MQPQSCMLIKKETLFNQAIDKVGNVIITTKNLTRS